MSVSPPRNQLHWPSRPDVTSLETNGSMQLPEKGLGGKLRFIWSVSASGRVAAHPPPGPQGS